MSSRPVTENHALVTVPVALIIQAMANRIAAMMTSMPFLLPIRCRNNRAGERQARRAFLAYDCRWGEVARRLPFRERSPHWLPGHPGAGPVVLLDPLDPPADGPRTATPCGGSPEPGWQRVVSCMSSSAGSPSR